MPLFLGLTFSWKQDTQLTFKFDIKKGALSFYQILPRMLNLLVGKYRVRGNPFGRYFRVLSHSNRRTHHQSYFFLGTIP